MPHPGEGALLDLVHLIRDCFLKTQKVGSPKELSYGNDGYVSSMFPGFEQTGVHLGHGWRLRFL